MRPLDAIGSDTLYEYLTGDPWGPCPLFARALAVLMAPEDAEEGSTTCQVEWPTYTAGRITPH